LREDFSWEIGHHKEEKMNDVIGSVRQALQDFLAPELRQHRAELVSIRGELDSKISVLENKMNVLDSKIGSGFSALGAQLENAVLRGELSTTREIADLRIRVERLERERGQLPQ
jgi:hypothetical protein